MSRSDHHGCGGPCGVCKPHKKWPSKAEDRPAVRRDTQYSIEDQIFDADPIQCRECIE